MMIGKGSKPAFEELFRRYAGRVVGYCARLVGDRGSGEDLAQEVWIRIAKAAPDWKPKASFRAWVLTIARNASLNFLRDRRKLGSFQENGDQEVAQAEASLDLGAPSALDTLMNAQNRDRLMRAIDELSDTKRTAIMMWLIEEMSQEEIARELAMSVAAVKSLLFRVRNDLEKAVA